jgi:hypothetical protein
MAYSAANVFYKLQVIVQSLLILPPTVYGHRLAGAFFIILFYISACNTIPPNSNKNEIKVPTAVQTQNIGNENGIKIPTVAPTQDIGNNGGISIQQDSLIPPIPPGQVRANLFDGFVELRWQGTGSDIDVHYIIYRRPVNSENWEKISTASVQGRNRGEYIFNDHTIESGVSYEYAIAVVDHYGNESSLSEIVKEETAP